MICLRANSLASGSISNLFRKSKLVVKQLWQRNRSEARRPRAAHKDQSEDKRLMDMPEAQKRTRKMIRNISEETK